MLTSAPKIRLFLDASAAIANLPAWPVHGEVYRPGEWLEGLVLQECGGRPDSRRYEPHHDRAARPDRASDPDTPDKDDGPAEDDASWGPMQVLGTNVRSIMGAKGSCVFNYSAVFWWPLGIAFGLKVLLGELAQTGRNVDRALARYNGGVTGDRLEPNAQGEMMMRRQVYVDGVENHAVRVRQNRLDLGWRNVELTIQTALTRQP
jgi:hypothetical protein